MSGFPVGRSEVPGWRLDVVGLLAILGESLMAHHVQSSSASKLCLLPRLIPAPQVFLKTARALRLPTSPATVCGVYSGMLVHELNYFADIIHPADSMNPFQVKVYDITWAGTARKSTWWDILSRGPTFRMVKAKNQYPEGHAMVPPRSWSPINIMTIISFFLTLGAFIWAILIRDGAAALALIAMSFASTLIGIASHWVPRLATRPSEAVVPKGDVVIRIRKGVFIIVHCSEEIAREIYTGPEECNYMVNDQVFRILVGFGSLLVIASVLLLGNCDWTMQTVIAIIYITLNALYWVASLLPREWLWDLSRYKCIDKTPEHLKDATEPGRDGQAPSYTRSLWYAIQATGEVDWVTLSGAAPKTSAWEEWLRLAHTHCDDPKWNAVAQKDKLMKQARFQTATQRSQRLHQQDEKAAAIIPVSCETV